ncbi:MAG: hypothetical protein P4L42_06470 [Desulfocapsaceae bacterium]|nr:hypothetical protein [Desulfocapsaceae bacterium]
MNQRGFLDFDICLYLIDMAGDPLTEINYMNQQIKEGKEPETWDEHKRCQKDVDARWTQKNGKNFFGYKNHISADVK